MKHRFILLTVTGLLLLLALPAPAAAGEPVGPAPTGLRPDAPTYALHGPFWVGTQAFVGDDGGSPLDVRVWYPALNPDNAAEATTYILHWNKYQFEGVDTSMVSEIAGHAIADALPDTGAGPYPLVVFSHGSGSEPVIYAWLLEHLASYGFVVIAPDHKEIIDATNSDLVRSTVARAQTIPHVLDFAGILTASTGALAGMIDMEHVAVAGQSYGGYTALAAAGARYDMDAYRERCTALAADDPNQFLCAFATSLKEMAGAAGLTSVPAGLWSAVSESRIDALVTMSGDSYMFGEKGLADIKMPVLALGGTRDTATPYDWGVRPTYDNIASGQKILVTFEGADHFISLTDCADAPSMIDYSVFYMCSDPVWDMSRAHDLMNHFITAYLLDLLKGDKNAAAALTPDAINFPGIRYEAVGF